MSEQVRGSGPRVVAFGGGHGLSASLAALRRVTGNLTAVVTVADDGGSSGRLRDELGVLPPGDLRMALATLADEAGDTGTWARLLQYRFPGEGPLSGHAAGNLVLCALSDQLGSPVPALDMVGRLVNAAGRVLPMSCQPVDIAADVAGLESNSIVEVRGQVAVATTRGRVLSVRLIPEEPPACPEALEATAEADALVIGPGSLFTSMLPHLLVPQLAEAIVSSSAQRILVLNIAPQPGETDGFAPETHLEALAAQSPELRLDVVIADSAAVPDAERLQKVADGLGARLLLSPVGVAGESRHDPVRLAMAFSQVLGQPHVHSSGSVHSPAAESSP